MTTRKITALVIMGALIAALSAASAFGADVKTTKLTLVLKNGEAVDNPTYDEAYTLTIPESLTIANIGWNAIGSMTVSYSGTSTGFDTSKKLVITASSTNTFTLKADGVSDTISYFLATSESDEAETTTFEFSAGQITAGASQPIGVNVEDFSTKSDGTYTDEIIYTVEIEDAGTTTTTTTTVIWNGSDITGSGKSFTKDGVTANLGGSIDAGDKAFYGDGTFTTTLGNFTKIEVNASVVPSGTGWSSSATLSGKTATWTGTASNSVEFSDSIIGISTIVFTIDTSAQ